MQQKAEAIHSRKYKTMERIKSLCLPSTHEGAWKKERHGGFLRL
jgi:hypothetical protein